VPRAPIERVSSTMAAARMDLVLYRVVDTLVDGYFPVLASLDDQIDELEDEILARPTDEQLGRLFDLRRL
jgi:magnesium transporter